MENSRCKYRAWDGESMIYMDMTKDGIYICGSHKALMQFTGLLDTNGIEIYEGDIVNHLLYSPFEDCNDCEIVKNGEVLMIDGQWCVKSGRYALFAFDNMIIGNIHENEELLDIQD